jgi:hypothetical protein
MDMIMSQLMEHDLHAIRQRSARTVRVVYGSLALLTAALAVLTGLAAGHLGLTQENRDTVSTIFLATAILEAAGMLLWDRLFGRVP